MNMRHRHSLAGWFVFVLAMGVVSGCGKREAEVPTAVAPVTAVSATNLPGSAAAAEAAFGKLPGKWQRSDGGYIIEIRSVEPGGKMDAAYFNPQPIHVARAEASQQGETVKVFLELRDVNYPGSTYTLAYDPAADQLKGIYYQAVQQQQFEVFFERLK
jgi:hypothetical protein